MVPLLCSAKETMFVTKLQDQEVIHKDFVELQNLPKRADNSAITVHYLCTRPCRVHVDIVASSEFQTGISVFKKRWKNVKYLHKPRTHIVNLKFPSLMIYRNDLFQKHYFEVYYTAVRAWIVHSETGDLDAKHDDTILHAVANTFAVLDTIPPFQRPYKDHQICLGWDFEHMWKQRENTIYVCPYETDVVKMLDFPLASSSGHHGIIKTFQNFVNRELELRRKQLVNNNPRFTFSIWMYLQDYCTSKECGIIHHIDTNKLYASPLLFLNDKGQVHVQMQLITGEDIAMLTKFQMPLYSWFRLDMSVNGRKILLTALLGAGLEIYGHQTFNVHEDIYCDDTSGYLAVGGSKYVRGIEGFFGPVRYYRLRALETDEISNPLLEDQIYHQITMYYQRCVNVQFIVQTYANFERQAQELPSQCTSQNGYMDMYTKYGAKPSCQVLPWYNKEKEEFSNLYKLLLSVDWKSLESSDDLVAEFAKRIFQNVTENLSAGLHHLGTSIPSLVDASCSGYHKASYLLAVMYEIGLGVPNDPFKGLLYSLVAAQGDDRLALLKLGYKHYQGTDNYPLDLDISFAYYMSIAKKTPLDRKTHNQEQAFVETIRLTDDEILKEQTRENEDLFLWLKQNAERGDAYAQHRLAQMYFWGQQGVSKNTKAAVEWYEKGALENEDPLLMYDYSVLLFKGDGVPKNKSLALKLMKKAAAKGQHEALNGLGWYYHNFRKDYANAAKYWRRAYDMGNVDSAFNLGVMYLNGIYPGEPEINETRAFEYISTASAGGHIEGTLQLVQYLITGNLETVPRDPKTAIILAKFAAEQNGHIGHVIRKALNAYLDGSIHEAFLYYILTAESGIEVSQTNLAYLCEENPEPAKTYLTDSCIWRYFNLSVQQNDPPSFALLKMGDLYYYGNTNQSRNLELSMELYTYAALQGDSQGFYNLAQLIQEGFSIPEHLLQQLEIHMSAHRTRDSLIVELYQRCQNHSKEDSFSPCSLPLLYIHFRAVWKSILQSSLIYMLGSLLLSILVAFTIRWVYSVQGMFFSSRRVQALHSAVSSDDVPSGMPAPENIGASMGNESDTHHSET
ncbi:protein sel-1 homolog 3 [Rhinophrynus dorsalis]